MTIDIPRKGPIQALWDFVGIPFRLVLFDQAWLPAWGWTTLEEERLRAVLPHLDGRLLDIGAGTNNLVKRHAESGEAREGVGIDVHDWGGGAIVVDDTSELPYDDASFDCVAFIACLNHIPNRVDVLAEARRLVKPGGTLAITMIDPILGGVGHVLWWYSEDKHRGGMKEGEVGGMWCRDIIRLCDEAGFELTLHRRFVYWMNNLLVFRARD